MVQYNTTLAITVAIGGWLRGLCYLYKIITKQAAYREIKVVFVSHSPELCHLKILFYLMQ